ncbi:DUF4199 domain-containing protein [Flavobacterium stagni]|uniref:DUF4199 domain-containing protein n=1 Tax=Flavobacterium stagni TaxID=2506421 RepID=A0A4Q1K9F8_9FLAO|nr:DUF4199 domain-containing protein [Flavobacterium stagni]RXR22498.1 DUF4199 domain-containing protein [Flavobacterium stagni]
MEQKTTVGKTILNYGALFGIVMVLEFVVGYVMNIDPQTNKTYGLVINLLNFLILPFALGYMGSNQYKKSNNGFISIGEAIKITVGMGAIAALIYSIFFWIFTIVFPDFIPELMEKIRSITIQQNPNLSKEQMEMSLSIMEKFMKPYVLIPTSILMYSFVGLIHGTIVGLIVKKEQATF